MCLAAINVSLCCFVFSSLLFCIATKWGEWIWHIWNIWTPSVYLQHIKLGGNYPRIYSLRVEFSFITFNLKSISVPALPEQWGYTVYFVVPIVCGQWDFNVHLLPVCFSTKNAVVQVVSTQNDSLLGWARAMHLPGTWKYLN